MITTAEQYNAHLHIIYNNNPPTYAALPTADNIYNVDIRTREIDAPLFLAVEKDSVSETIYFIVDRYADYMDLSTTGCIITYTSAKGITRLYAVPFYDIYSYAHQKKMIIPWNLDSGIAEEAGDVEFAIQFYKTDIRFNEKTQRDEPIISYSLNTQTAHSKILQGIESQEIEANYRLPATELQQMLQRVNDFEAYLKNEGIMPSWIILPD